MTLFSLILIGPLSACMQKILRILLLRPENSARGLQEIERDFQRIPGRAARADPSVRQHRRLAQALRAGGAQRHRRSGRPPPPTLWTCAQTDTTRSLRQLDGIDINIGDTWCHRVIYVLEQRDSMVSNEGRNLPILITS